MTPSGGSTASIPVLVEVEDDVVDPDPEETDGTDGTDGTEGTDDTDDEDGAPPT